MTLERKTAAVDLIQHTQTCTYRAVHTCIINTPENEEHRRGAVDEAQGKALLLSLMAGVQPQEPRAKRKGLRQAEL